SAHHITFDGGDDDDTFISSNAGGSDSFNGGSGVDTVDYSHVSPGGVTVDLSAGTATRAGADSVLNVQNVTGPAQAATITGSTSDNTFTGGGGNDTMHGGSGIDTATFADSFANASTNGSTWNGTTATVVTSEGTDTLDSVERATFAGDGKTVW